MSIIRRISYVPPHGKHYLVNVALIFASCECTNLAFYFCAPPLFHTVSGPIPLDRLVDYVRRLQADNGRLLAAEFECIDPGGQFTWTVSNRPENRGRNRYANVVAYDHSRVRLLRPSPTQASLEEVCPSVSEYINANYLDGFGRSKAYIATQVRTNTDSLEASTI
ncbi:unnamed protein product [Protopolystoma xenopodis]|uniref:Tyrosine-protein phosphatase domain-containing protein n=1 Tax=Protopolystoma xenopodis TaxID=117903 RepID=A0A3S5BVE2_9PLAT|nr:unnamed protein product [Protopolystoma xenopodis]